MRNAVIGVAAAAAGLLLAASQSGSAVAGMGVPQVGHDSSLVEQVRRDGGDFRGGGHFRGGSHFRGGHDRSPRRIYGGNFRGHRDLHGRFHGRRHWRGGRWWYGAPFVYGGYAYYGECGGLRRRAIVTGSRYWWRRYQACRGSY